MPELESAEKLSAEQILNRVRVKRALNRRNFLAGLGITSAAAAGGALLAGCGGTSMQKVAAAGPSETDVLNFALNLEYLEATFYSYVVTGGDIPSGSTGGGPAPTGAPSATPSFQNQQIADMFRDLLRRDQPCERPAVGARLVRRGASAAESRRSGNGEHGQLHYIRAAV